jgi:mRNA-degrading endonuclease toxin of MazEF toxin-antitoxin module
VVLPLTTNIKEGAFPIRVKIPAGVCGLEKDSDALVDQILAWDIELFRKDLGEIPEGLQEIVKSAVRDFLDL